MRFIFKLLGFLLALVLVVGLLLTAAFFFLGAQPTGGGASARRSGVSSILIAGTDDEGYRTDTIMLLTVDSKNKTARLLSIPRDTRVNAPYSVPKINSACGWAGGGAEGMAELTERVAEVVGFRPDGYVMINLDAFVKIVDIMGGVDFDVPVDMHYSDPVQELYIDLSAGPQHLDGEQAMGLVRFRSGYAMADLRRVEVQRDFVQAALSQWLKLENVTKIPKILSALDEGVTTTLNRRELLWLVKSLLSCDRENMQMQTLPGEPATINGGSYFVADADAAERLREFDPAA